ncbi:alpha-ketoglutarate-dependent dioxygenase AlkB [Endozoicomonas gorgoniicola]|uniref:Alpha-ketoglutarate-dependent dioxygenase AlkB n=1 Tax=Endozoicomonas gorgoniicola TaxID=1234144 RepID=A0ABT3MZ70_9GAMM|nr:alpha-ketoglutarate-dependent dioxygenase AlkB [Endozoicomonas gorgoniicola]MCW7554662.1 alpha-ketoglutarate-dependent dioxygenase AlkB [Endozoicomonas gorgoniicola]
MPASEFISATIPATIPAKDAQLQFWSEALAPAESRKYFDDLIASTPWRQDKIRLFGRHVAIPRLQAWYGDTHCHYSYSGLRLAPLPWAPQLLQLKARVEQLCQHRFNCVLLNLYRSGSDSNGWHSDDEPELGLQPVIASLSLGATRRFKLRHKYDNTVAGITIDLSNGSLLVMSGHSQSHWQHCLPKTARQIEPRINLTFRNILHGPN